MYPNFKQIAVTHWRAPATNKVELDLITTDPIGTTRKTLDTLIDYTRDGLLRKTPDNSVQDYDNTFIVNVATTTALPAVIYNNGVLGVGATLVGVANGALPAIDGVTLAVGQTVLVKDQPSQVQNGPYEVTDPGSISTVFTLTRLTTSDESLEINRSIVSIIGGTNNASQSFVQITATPTVGTSPIIYQRQNNINTVTDIKLSYIISQRSKTQAFGGMRQAVSFDNFVFASGLGSANIIKMDYNGDVVGSVNVAGVKTGSLAISYAKRRVYFPTNTEINIYNADTLAFIKTIPYGSTIGITGIAASGDVVMVADVGASQVRIYNENTNVLLGTLATVAGVFFATQDGRYAYFGGNGVGKITMSPNFTNYTLSHAGFSQTPVVVQDKIYLTYTSGNSHVVISKNNAAFLQFINAPTQPRGVGSNGYMVGYGNFGANSWNLYDYRNGQQIATGSGTGNPHCIGFIRNRMFVLDGNTGNIVIVENTGNTFVLPPSGTRLYRDVDYEIMRAVSSTGVIKEMTVPA